MGALRNMLEDLSNTILDRTTLKASPQIIDARTVPNAGTNGTFSLSISTVNAGDRDRRHIRLNHTLTVNVLWRIKMNSQFESQVEALDIEEDILDALMDQASNPSLNIFYIGSTRTLSPSKEYMLISLSFKVEQTIAIVS